MPDSTEEKDSEFISEEETEQGPAAIKKLREKLKKAVEEKQEYLDGWQRARADFANFKKEEANAHGEKEERIKAEFVESLLSALDAFELALKHSPTEELKIVHNLLIDSLKQVGVEQFGAIGEKFDPQKHEALAQTGNGEKVVSVECSGYSVGVKVIRPAQVII